MKKHLLTISIIIITFINTSSSQITLIPDSNFEQALIDLGWDTDGLNGQVLTSNISNRYSVYIQNKNISDLTGIADFVGTSVLEVSNNSLTTIDISGLQDLLVLKVNSNSLTSLDITQNVDLLRLECQSNQLTSLDVTQNTDLTLLWLPFNQVSSLDVSNNTALTALYPSYNQLTTFDVSNNTNLGTLWLGSNSNLTSVNFGSITTLVDLRLDYTGLTNIDVSQMSSLTYLTCNNSDLTELNVKNGNNTNMPNASFWAQNNANLTCIEVDDPTWSNANWTHKDAVADYELDCSVVSIDNTYIPDDNFEQRLIALGYDTAPLNDSVPTANISNITNLHLQGVGIADFTGIQDFVSLEVINFSGNSMPIVDLSNSPNLQSIVAWNCSFSSLIIGNNPNLETLTFGYNSNISALDLSTATSLTTLTIQNTNLNTIDLSNNIALEHIDLHSNNLISLNLVANLNLLDVDINNNDLTSIVFGNNTLLIALYCDENNLINLDLSLCIGLEIITCRSNSLQTLDLSQNNNLQELYCSNNSLTSLDLATNTALIHLDCTFNELTALNIKNQNNHNIANNSLLATNNFSLFCIQVDDPVWSEQNWNNISNNTHFFLDCTLKTYIPDDQFESQLVLLNRDILPLDDSIPTANIYHLLSLYVNASDLTGIQDFENLENLDCTNISNLDLSNNVKIKTLKFNQSNIISIDLSSNVQLEELTCWYQNSFTTIILGNKPNLKKVSCYDNQLTALDISNSPNLEKLNCTNNQITNLDLTNKFELKNLFCANNNLSSLDLSNLPKIEHVNCSDNNIMTIDITNSLLIKKIWCLNTSITNIDFINNNAIELIDLANNSQLTTATNLISTSLTTLNIASTGIASLDLSNLIGLNELFCENSIISSLDLSSNVNLNNFDCYETPISELNLKNGNNMNLTFYSVFDNPNLQCVQVDDPVWFENNFYNDPNVTVSADCSILPIELIHFSIKKDNKEYVKLDWKTAAEVNFEKFEIERSIDGNQWVKIGTILQQESRDLYNQYYFNDNNPEIGTNYYRLKQIDRDGFYELSKTVSILHQINMTKVYPNPVQDVLNIETDINSQIEIFNNLGQKIKTIPITIGHSSIDMSGLQNGIYLIRAINGQSYKVIKR